METQTAIAAPVRQLINSINKIIELQAKNLEFIADGKPVENPVTPKDWELVLKIIDKMPNFTQFEKIANGETIVPTKEKEQPAADETITEQDEPTGNAFEQRSKIVKARISGTKTD